MSEIAPPAELPFKTVEALLMRLARIGEDDRTAFLGRFQYIQRMDFPVARVGRGRKVAYGLEEIWQLALVFELLQIGVTPVRAVRLVRTSWPAARRAVARSWTTDRLASRPMLVLFPRALQDLKPEAGAERLPSRDAIGILDAADLVALVTGEVEEFDEALTVQVDPRRLGVRIVRALDLVGIPDGAAMMDAFARAVTERSA